MHALITSQPLLPVLALVLATILIWTDLRLLWLPGWATTALAILGLLDANIEEEVWLRASSIAGVAVLLSVAVLFDYGRAWIRQRQSGTHFHRLALPTGDIALLLAISTWFEPFWLGIAAVLAVITGLAAGYLLNRKRLPLGPVFLVPAATIKLLMMAVLT